MGALRYLGPAMAARLSIRMRKGALFARRLVILVPPGARDSPDASGHCNLAANLA